MSYMIMIQINENGYGYLSIEEIINESVNESRAQTLEEEIFTL